MQRSASLPTAIEIRFKKYKGTCSIIQFISVL
jgi:hypothetical protein